MALTLTQSADLYFNSGEEFRQKAAIAFGRVAVSIFLESPTTEARQTWARSFAVNPVVQTRVLFFGFISTPLIEANGAGASDAEILTAAGQVINALYPLA